MAANINNNTARMATLDELIETTIPLFIKPIPTKQTLRSWFKLGFLIWTLAHCRH